ncbi:MAG: hypothetical protein EXQ56_00005, partial [Acidobacteria bacterium]|nr:hypothetical protein [Acidobacteriota bacterium]
MKKATLVFALLCSPLAAQAQNANVAARLGYPQTIFYNGKIVSMNDASFESKIGTVAEALAVRDDKILA